MRKTIVYIAMSLDGYIADAKGSVAFLDAYGINGELEHDYDDFISRVDTLIMGKRTYDQIHDELFVDAWPYTGITSVIFTHQTIKANSDIIFCNQDLTEWVRHEKEKQGGDIWIVGGASIIHQLQEAKLIDEWIITIIPTLLGNGISLFQTSETVRKLHYQYTKTYDSGLITIAYKNN